MSYQKHTITGSLIAFVGMTTVMLFNFLSNPPDPRLVEASTPRFGALHITNADVSDQELLKDGDMEWMDTSLWFSDKRGTITKEDSNPQSGTQLLRIAYKGFTLPSVTREVLKPGAIYRLTGWARGDGQGSGIPQLFSESILWSGINSHDWQPFDFVLMAKEEILKFQASIIEGYVEFDNVSLVEIDETIKPGSRLRFALTNMRVANINGHKINMHICPGDTKFFDYESDFCNGSTGTICSAYGVDPNHENAVCEELEPNLVPKGTPKGEKFVKVYIEDEFKNPGRGENKQSYEVR